MSSRRKSGAETAHLEHTADSNTDDLRPTHVFREPAVALTVFVPIPEHRGADDLHDLLDRFDHVLDAYRDELLQRGEGRVEEIAAPNWLYTRAMHVADHLDRPRTVDSSDELEPLMNLSLELQAEPDSEQCQCLIYRHHDTLVLQLFLGTYDAWTSSLSAGWNRLNNRLLGLLRPEPAVADALRRAGAFGVSLLYWSIAQGDGLPTPREYAGDVAEVLQQHDTRFSQTDLGPLWQADLPAVELMMASAQDRWVLLTRGSDESQDEVHRRYFEPNGAFVVSTLQRYKYLSQRQEYVRHRQLIEQSQMKLKQLAGQVVQTEAKLSAQPGGFGQ